MSGKVLCIDRVGYPIGWLSAREAVCYYALNEVLWELGAKVATFRSGVSRMTGEQTIIEPASIIGISGQSLGRAVEKPPTVSGRNRKILFARDRHVCGYCGDSFGDDDLSKDHILPLSRGGSDNWMNAITACKPCNQRKADKTPQEAGMQLIFTPYVPSRYEGLILRNRNILMDQMDFLMAKVPKHSRLWV